MIFMIFCEPSIVFLIDVALCKFPNFDIISIRSISYSVSSAILDNLKVDCLTIPPLILDAYLESLQVEAFWGYRLF